MAWHDTKHGCLLARAPSQLPATVLHAESAAEAAHAVPSLVHSSLPRHTAGLPTELEVLPVNALIILAVHSNRKDDGSAESSRWLSSTAHAGHHFRLSWSIM
jgi:hypothetical protein